MIVKEVGIPSCQNAGIEVKAEDTELGVVDQEPAVPQMAAPAPNSYRCRHCQGTNLVVTYGRYSYSFKCLSCDDNTPISETCENCGNKARIRKEGDTFYAECSDCKTSRRFYTHPSSVKV